MELGTPHLLLRGIYRCNLLGAFATEKGGGHPFHGFHWPKRHRGNSGHTVDGRNPAPPKKPWKDSIVFCKCQQKMVSHAFKMVRNGFCPSTVASQILSKRNSSREDTELARKSCRKKCAERFPF